jgi:hypothetical protein
MTHVLEIAVGLFLFGWLWFITVESLVSIGCHEDDEQIELELVNFDADGRSRPGNNASGTVTGPDRFRSASM